MNKLIEKIIIKIDKKIKERRKERKKAAFIGFCYFICGFKLLMLHSMEIYTLIGGFILITSSLIRMRSLYINDIKFLLNIATVYTLVLLFIYLVYNSLFLIKSLI